MAERNAWDALSDSTRREILLMLRNAPCSAGQIAEQFSISKPSISHHLNLLREAGLVRSEKRGQHNYYMLIPETFAELRAFLSLFPDAADDARTTLPAEAAPTREKPKAPAPAKKQEEAPPKKRASVPVYF